MEHRARRAVALVGASRYMWETVAALRRDTTGAPAVPGVGAAPPPLNLQQQRHTVATADKGGLPATQSFMAYIRRANACLPPEHVRGRGDGPSSCSRGEGGGCLPPAPGLIQVDGQPADRQDLVQDVCVPHKLGDPPVGMWEEGGGSGVGIVHHALHN